MWYINILSDIRLYWGFTSTILLGETTFVWQFINDHALVFLMTQRRYLIGFSTFKLIKQPKNDGEFEKEKSNTTHFCDEWIQNSFLWTKWCSSFLILYFRSSYYACLLKWLTPCYDGSTTFNMLNNDGMCWALCTYDSTNPQNGVILPNLIWNKYTFVLQ